MTAPGWKRGTPAAPVEPYPGDDLPAQDDDTPADDSPVTEGDAPGDDDA